MQTPLDQTSKNSNWGNLSKDLIFEILKYNEFPSLYQPNKWWRTTIKSDQNRLEFFKGFSGLKEQAMQGAIKNADNSKKPELPSGRKVTFTNRTDREQYYLLYHHQRDLLTILKSLQKRITGIKKLLKKPSLREEHAKKIFTKKLKKVISLVNDAETIFAEISEISTEQSLSVGAPIITMGEKLGFIPAADNSTNQNGKENRRSIAEIKQGLELLLNSPEAVNRKATLLDLQSLSNKSRVAIKTLSSETRTLNSESPSYAYNYDSMLYHSLSDTDLTEFLAYRLIENSHQETNQLQWLVAEHINHPEQREKTFNKLPKNINDKIKKKLQGVLFPQDPAMLCLYKASELLRDINHNNQTLKFHDNFLDYREGNYGNLLHWGSFFINTPYTDSKLEKASLYFFDGLAQMAKPLWAPFFYMMLASFGPTLKEETKNFLPLLSLAKLLGADISRYYQTRYDEKFAKVLEEKIKLPELRLSDVFSLKRKFAIPASYQLIKLEIQLLTKEYNQQILCRFKHTQRHQAIASLNSLIEQLDDSKEKEEQKLLILSGGIHKYRDETLTSHTHNKGTFSSFLQHKLNTQSTLEMELTNIINSNGLSSSNKSKALTAYNSHIAQISNEDELSIPTYPSIGAGQ